MHAVICLMSSFNDFLEPLEPSHELSVLLRPKVANYFPVSSTGDRPTDRPSSHLFVPFDSKKFSAANANFWDKHHSTHSVVVSYKPSMLVTGVRFPVCALRLGEAHGKGSIHPETMRPSVASAPRAFLRPKVASYFPVCSNAAEH